MNYNNNYTNSEWKMYISFLSEKIMRFTHDVDTFLF
jgi:hypothetical protein